MSNSRTMRPVYQVAALLIFIAGLLFLRESLKLHYYTSIGPGPGFFPVWLSAILTLLAVLMFFLVTFTRSPGTMPDGLFPNGGGALRIVAIAVALGSAALLLEHIGFGPTMFLMNMFVLLVLTKRHFLLILTIALIGGFGVEYLFTHWLNVPLPKTDLGTICPRFMCGG